MDLFERRTLSPMLIGAEQPAFDSPDYLYELKLDGVRCLAYLSDKTELINKRSLMVAPIYPELKEIHKQNRAKRVILDGELIVMKDGKPDFFEMQRRALKSNATKIAIAANSLPVTFITFDILYKDGKDLTTLPLKDRKAILDKTIRDGDRMAKSRVIDGSGTALFDLTQKQGLEGIVAKRKDSLYHWGKRTKQWIKSKNLMDDDYVITGYIPKDAGVTSIVIAQYDATNSLKYKGHVTLGVSGEVFRKISSLPHLAAPAFEPPSGNENAAWVSPMLVCTVKFMEKHKNGGLRQPVFKGLRDDKTPEECRE